jgi:hypothetical protein
MGTDDACLFNDQDNDSCAPSFNFFITTSQSGLSDLDGILGLGPPLSGNGPSFYQNLMQQQPLLGSQVSFSIGDESYNS